MTMVMVMCLPAISLHTAESLEKFDGQTHGGGYAIECSTDRYGSSKSNVRRTVDKYLR